MTTFSLPTKLAVVAVAALVVSACTPRRPAESAGGTEIPPPVNTGPYQPPRVDNGGMTGGPVGAAVPGSEQDFVVNVGDRVYFDLDSYEVRPEAFARLGARRAESVRTYLVQRGISPARIDTISFGKERPIAAGSNEESWARNRNAHTAIAGGAPR